MSTCVALGVFPFWILDFGFWIKLILGVDFVIEVY